MRKFALASLACAVAAMPATAIAQATPTRSTDDYVCAFAGNCDGDASEEAAPAATGRGTPRTSSTRGFSLAAPSKPASGASKRKPTGSKPAQRQMASASTKPRPPVAAQGQRADLRLSFELGSSTLTRVAEAEAKVFAQSLMRPELQGMKFVIEGHTDSQGSREYNIDLSRRRAQAVADYLVTLGVARDRLDVRGFGFDRPLPGRSASAQANRRVEAVRVS